jgi:hypothetical protein
MQVYSMMSHQVGWTAQNNTSTSSRPPTTSTTCNSFAIDSEETYIAIGSEGTYIAMNYDTIRIAAASILQVLFIWLFLRYIFPVLQINIHVLVSVFVYFSTHRVIHFIIMDSATVDPSSCMSHATLWGSYVSNSPIYSGLTSKGVINSNSPWIRRQSIFVEDGKCKGEAKNYRKKS